LDKQDRRRFRRTLTEATASLFNQGTYLGRYRVQNLSAGGALVTGPDVTGPSRVRVLMDLPTGRLSVDADIIRLPDDDPRGPLVAVQFDHDPARETEDKIQNAVLHELELTQATRGILVVDDFDPIRRALDMQLRQWGYYPILATCAEEALEHLDRSSVVFDAALLDIDLVGESGWDLAAHLAESHPEIRRIVMSGRYIEGQLQLGAEQGLADATLTKPWTERDLAAALSVAQ
jgi:CheY-like chemotaxis protein